MAKLTDKFDKLNFKKPGKPEGTQDKKISILKRAAESLPEEPKKAKEPKPKKAVPQPKQKKPAVPKAPISEKSKKNMVVKFLFGIVVLIVFIIFAYISISVAPHSSDIPDDYQLAKNYHRGVEREVSVPAPVVQNEAPVQETNELPSGVVEEIDAQAVETNVELEQTEETRPEVLKAQQLGLPAPPEIDVNSWEFILVNTTHTIDEDFRPETFAALNLTLTETDIQTTTDDYSETRCLVDSRIGENLRDFGLACQEAGLPVYLSSGYRSYSTQNYLYQRKIGQGYSEDVAATIVARPGTSEHQTGLSCDITDRYRETKDSSLADTDTYKWLCEHCTEYGFVVRYPEDKSGSADSITGIIYEPWHFRYVGKEVAEYMMNNNLCLEEFLALYE